MERALGRVSISQQDIMGIVARGTHHIEEATFLPKLPEGVRVRSVHDDPISMSQIFILESEKPVEGWTDYVESGLSIPLSPVATQTMKRAVDHRYDPEYMIKKMTIRELLFSFEDVLEGEDIVANTDMTIYEYLRLIAKEVK
jgi:hypothetical protein